MLAIVSPTRVFVRLVQASLKASSAIVRSAGVGAVASDWPARAEACARCPLVYVQCGKSYCGKPFLKQIEREEHVEGCGCPVLAKAKDPAEHCPRNARFQPSSKSANCDCVWCATSKR
jgi:hypothetical protein